jgi:hypothetical protein
VYAVCTLRTGWCAVRSLLGRHQNPARPQATLRVGCCSSTSYRMVLCVVHPARSCRHPGRQHTAPQACQPTLSLPALCAAAHSHSLFFLGSAAPCLTSTGAGPPPSATQQGLRRLCQRASQEAALQCIRGPADAASPQRSSSSSQAHTHQHWRAGRQDARRASFRTSCQQRSCPQHQGFFASNGSRW